MKKLIIIFVFLFLVGCNKSYSKEDIEVYNFIDDINNSSYLSSYTIYGKYFNISGFIKNDDNLKLVLKSNDKELEYNLIMDNKKFKTNKLINEGIDLEKIEVGNYLILLKGSNGYYNFIKDNKLDDLEYYKVTRNNKNYEININFKDINNKTYLVLDIKEKELPKNIFDIVIDAGHGGKDIGASNKGEYESNYTLEYSKLLKDKLESLGLKVKMTREKDESIPNYGENGRVTIPYKAKAKLMLSIHLNSSNIKTSLGGVEVYVPYNSNITFAKDLVNNIVLNTSTIYSKNPESKIDDGVYLRTLSKSDLKMMEEDAKRDGYKPYEKASTKSTYYYIIRETGGIITQAYVDNRNPKKEGNPYVNSNHGCETYLVELGYISSTKNLEILKIEKEKYIDAIVSSIKKYLEIE